jgi:tetratricopeptide (TPR) repeat protein
MPSTLKPLTGLLLLLAGCSMLPQGLTPPDRETPKSKSASSSRVTAVDVDSDGLVLGESEGAGLAPAGLLSLVSGRLAEGRTSTARREVQGYPETAWQLLRGPVPATDATALRTVADAHDRQCVARGAAGWQSLLADRAQRPLPYQHYAQRRAEFLARLREGFPGHALTTHPLPPATDGLPVLLAIDAWQLTGTGLLLDGRPGEASEAFRKGVELAAGNYPYYEAHLRLQKSESLRSAGRIDEADAAWSDAVHVALAEMRADPPVLDPDYWQRVAYHRPVHQPWPTGLIGTLAALAARCGVLSDSDRALDPGGPADASSERYLWACMGHWWLERGEPQAALMALKRAGDLAENAFDRQRLELAQARALMALEQPAAATTLLVAIGDSTDPQVRADALATLGTLRLAAGSTRQGHQLLGRALESPESVDWPGRGRAEADYGLAHLLVGDASAGIGWLHRAQARFEAAGAHEDLIQSLENELAYAQRAKQKDQVRALRQRIEQLQL